MDHHRFVQATDLLEKAAADRRRARDAAEQQTIDALRHDDRPRAIAAIERLLEQQPDAARWWHELAIIRQQEGDAASATAAWRQALRGKIERLELLHRIGQGLAAAGHDPARFAADIWASPPPAASTTAAQGRRPPELQEAWLDVLRGNWAGALPAVKQACLSQLAHRPSARNLAFLFERLGRPGHAQCILAANRLAQGRFREAVEAFKAAPETSAHAPEFLDVFLVALRRTGEEQRAIEIAASIAPGNLSAESWLEWAKALMDLHRHEEARETLRRGATVLDDPHLRQQAELMMPRVPASQAAMDDAFRHASRAIHALADAPLPAEQKHLQRLEETLRPNFLLAYAGTSCIEEARAYGRYARRLMQARHPRHAASSLPPRQRSPGERIRIGYATSHASRHVVMMYFAGWLQHADRDQFELHLFPLASERSQVSGYLANLVDTCHPATDQTGIAAQQISDAGLDILVYPEIGLDPLTFRLAAMRLAPVQCVASGHPVTSGLDTMDYFLSYAGLEPPDAAAHYTERLVALPGTGIAMARPALPDERRPRGDFGLAPDEIVYLSPQSLFKYPPRHDDIHARIAEAVDNAVFVFVEGDFPAWSRTFRDRLRPGFERRGLDLDRHLRFVPRQDYETYLSLIAAGDIFLDPLGGFGAGTTAIDALACGVPLVTLPGTQMRTRYSYGILTGLGITDTIATSLDDYVHRAIQLGQNAALRSDVSRRIQEQIHLLFNHVRGTRGLEAFFRQAAGAGQAGDRELFEPGRPPEEPNH